MPIPSRFLVAVLCIWTVACGGASSSQSGSERDASAGSVGQSGAAGRAAGGDSGVGGSANETGGTAGVAGSAGSPTPPRLFVTGLAYGGGSYVATAEIDVSDEDYYGAIYRSVDGVTWTRTADRLSLVPFDVAYGNGRFVAIGLKFDPDTSALSVGALNSEDGLRWSEPSVPATVLSGLAFGAGVFMTQSNEGHLVSEDGVLWTTSGGEAQDSALGGSPLFAAGRFLSCPSGPCAVGSGDGDWQPVTMIDQSHPDDRIYSPYHLRVVNDGFLGSAYYDCCFGEVPGTARWRKLSSPNGIDWTLDPEELTSAPPEIVFDDGSLCIAFSGAQLMSGTSCDALTTSASVPDFWPEFFVKGDGFFLAAGDGGIVSSSDGVTWTQVLHGY